MRAGVAGLVGLLLAGGCSGGEDPELGTPGPSTTVDDEEVPELSLEPSTSTTTTPDDTALLEVLPTEVLGGFALTDVRALDLESAAALEIDVDAERALLSTRGFRQGASRTWTDSGDDVVYEAAYRFTTPADAAAYLADGAEQLAARAAVPFEVPEPPGAIGFTTLDEDETGTFTAHAVAFASGDRWFLVLVGSPGSGRTPEDARALAVTLAGRAAATP